jgi:hypothetical protein
MACVASQSISSHWYDSLTRNLSFASATAIAIAPADERPSAQELLVGNSTAKCSAAQAALVREHVRSREGGRARLGKSQPSSRKGGLNRPGHW